MSACGFCIFVAMLACFSCCLIHISDLQITRLCNERATESKSSSVSICFSMGCVEISFWFSPARTALDTCCSGRRYRGFLTLTERGSTHFNEICVNISWCVLVVGLGDLSAADSDWSFPLLTKIIISSRQTADRDTCCGPSSLTGSVRAVHGRGEALPGLQPVRVKLAEVFLHGACATKAIENSSKKRFASLHLPPHSCQLFHFPGLRNLGVCRALGTATNTE